MVGNRRFRRGQILFLFVLLVPVLFGFAGLAFDAVVALIVKAHLVTTIDASALSGLRAIPKGDAAVVAVVDRTFNANFPEGWLMTISRSYSGPTVENVLGGQKVTVTGTARAPTFFMGLFGVTQVDVNAIAVAVRRDVNLVLVLDYSGSLEDELPDVKQAAKAFVEAFDDGDDQLGLATFSTAGRLDYPPQGNFAIGMNTQIDAIQTVWSTNFSLGLWLAYKALLDLPDPEKQEKYNAIVFFTDGEPTSFTGLFPVNTDCTTTTCTWWGGCTTTPVPCCDSSPLAGVLSGVNGNSYDASGLYNKDAPAAPVPGEEVLAACTMDSANDVEDLVLSIPDAWYPNGIGIAPAISIYGGPNSVSTGSLSSSNLRDIAENMQIATAEVARQDPLDITIFAIGLGDVDQTALRRVANDPNSAFYNPDQAEGKFIYADDVDDLLKAFKETAGSVARLGQ